MDRATSTNAAAQTDSQEKILYAEVRPLGVIMAECNLNSRKGQGCSLNRPLAVRSKNN